MTREQIETRMAAAFREDRDRLFKVIDGMRFQPKYADRLSEIETIADTWRDAPQQEDFPNIDHPAPLPEWFPKVRFFSGWEKDTYITQKVAEFEQRKIREQEMKQRMAEGESDDK